MDKARDMKRELFEIGNKLYSDFHYDKGKWKASVWYLSCSSEYPCTWITCLFSLHLFVTPLLLFYSLLYLQNLSSFSHLALRGAAVTPVVRRSCPPMGATEGFVPPVQEARRGSGSCLRWASNLSCVLPHRNSKARHIAQVPVDPWG